MVRSLSWIRRQFSPIAIDWGHRVVRMAQLATHRGQVTLVHYAQRELPPGIEDPTELEKLQTEAVRGMLAHERFSGRNVVTALDWNALTIKSVRLAVPEEASDTGAIRLELADRIGLDPVFHDVRYLVAGDVREGTAIGQEYIVMAAARATIESQAERLQTLGLIPAAIDAAPCAVFRCFQRFLRRDKDQDTTLAYLDMGYSGARILVSRGPKLVFVRTVPISGARLDEMVSQHLDLSLTDAVALRIRLHRYHAALLAKTIHLSNEPEMVSDSMRRALLGTIRPALDHLGKEIAQALRYCSTTFRGLRIRNVFVVGGEAFNIDMLQFLSDQVGVPFEPGRPLRNIALEPSLQVGDRRTGQPEWGTLLGLGQMRPVRAAVVRS